MTSRGRRSCSSAARRAGSCPACGSACRARSSRASGSRWARCASSPRRPGSAGADIEALLRSRPRQPVPRAVGRRDHDRGGLRGPARLPMPSRASPTSTTARTWHALEEAHEQVIWPGYRTAIERIRDDLSDPDRAAWFELTLDGAAGRGRSRGRPAWPAGRLGPVIDTNRRAVCDASPIERRAAAASSARRSTRSGRPTASRTSRSRPAPTRSSRPTSTWPRRSAASTWRSRSSPRRWTPWSTPRMAGALARLGGPGDPQPRRCPGALRRSGRRPRADRDGRR